jgi:hypothetical protein
MFGSFGSKDTAVVQVAGSSEFFCPVPVRNMLEATLVHRFFFEHAPERACQTLADRFMF